MVVCLFDNQWQGSAPRVCSRCPFLTHLGSLFHMSCCGEEPLALPRDLDGECMGLQSRLQDLKGPNITSSFKRNAHLVFDIHEVSSF